MNIKEIRIDISARDFITTRLSHGHTLAKTTLEETDLSKGTTITWLPSDISTQEVYSFDRGGKLAPTKKECLRPVKAGRIVRTPNTNDFLVEHIEKYFRTTRFPICLFENAYATPSDRGIKMFSSRLWFLEQNVYHVILPSDQDRSKIWKTISESQHIPNFIGVLSSLPDGEIYALRTQQYLLPNDIRTIVRSLDEIIVGAYDGESYLVWRKEK